MRLTDEGGEVTVLTNPGPARFSVGYIARTGMACIMTAYRVASSDGPYMIGILHNVRE